MTPSRTQLKELAQQAQELVQECKKCCTMQNQNTGSGKYILEATAYLFSHKKIFLFSTLHWGVVTITFLLFLLSVYSVLRGILSQDSLWLLLKVCIVVLGWIIGGIYCVSYLCTSLSSCVIADVIIQTQGLEHGILTCFKKVLVCSSTLKPISWFDGKISIETFQGRWPGRVGLLHPQIQFNTTYQSWKLCLLGLLPSILQGYSLSNARHNVLDFLRNRFEILCKLRKTYTTICWIVVLTCFISELFFSPFLFSLLPITNFYVIGIVAFLPTIIFLAVLFIFVRPIYLIATTRLYMGYYMQK